MKRVCILLVIVALITGMIGCEGEDGQSYTLTISSTTGGSVAEPGEGTFTYDEGTVVNLLAAVWETAEGWGFVEWTGDVDTVANVKAATTTVTMKDNYTITANFALGIWDWYGLDAIRENLSGSYGLMNDLDSTTAGYEQLASETANNGTGWQPIGSLDDRFNGTVNGQGYEIRDMFINRSSEDRVGLFGFIGEGVVKNIGVANITVTGFNGVGGLVGGNMGTVTNSYSTGSITGDFNVGGLVGGNTGTVTNSYSTGDVTGYEAVGGLVGVGGTVSNSYSASNVAGDHYVGGLVGYYFVTVVNSYATGSVTGNDTVGGLVGYVGSGTVTNSFWNTETSGQATSAGGTGKTTAEMQDIGTFSGATWDIVGVANLGIHNLAYIWNIVDDETYPFLSWQP